jgi:hypothetical protein
VQCSAVKLCCDGYLLVLILISSDLDAAAECCGVWNWASGYLLVDNKDHGCSSCNSYYLSTGTI